MNRINIGTKSLIGLSLLTAVLAGCSAQNVDAIKAIAPKTIEQAGFEIIGYEGYQWTGLGRWGGCVWYTMKKKPDKGTTYHGCVSKWGEEYHIYQLTAIDAIGTR
jgi:hypothetical protein